MATKQARCVRLLSAGSSYDHDRLSYDKQKLRQFYLSEGYADFRVISAFAELTPNKRDFIITYVVEEGDRYKFGDVTVQSDIRDLQPDTLRRLVPMKKGDWYNAKQVEDTVTSMTETARSEEHTSELQSLMRISYAVFCLKKKKNKIKK